MAAQEWRNVEVTLVLPAYNESTMIEQAVFKSFNELDKITPNYEVIIAEDGSTDGTDVITKRLTNVYDSLIHLHSDERLGRGKAIKGAFKAAHGRILAYMDVDLATDVSHLGQLIGSIREGFDISIGSRTHPESTIERSWQRSLTSRLYNGFVNLLLKTDLHDHQCGFKAFKKDSIISIIDDIEDEHWFWDTEVLAIGIRRGLRVKEIPITWIEAKGTKVNLFKDSISMMLKTLHLWWRIQNYSYLSVKQI